MSECKTCQRVIDGISHDCPPKWMVWADDESILSAETMYRYTPEDAAEAFVGEWLVLGEYLKANKRDYEDVRVCVQPVGGEVQRFDVMIEAVHHFCASEVV